MHEMLDNGTNIGCLQGENEAWYARPMWQIPGDRKRGSRTRLARKRRAVIFFAIHARAKKMEIRCCHTYCTWTEGSMCWESAIRLYCEWDRSIERKNRDRTKVLTRMESLRPMNTDIYRNIVGKNVVPVPVNRNEAFLEQCIQYFTLKLENVL